MLRATCCCETVALKSGRKIPHWLECDYRYQKVYLVGRQLGRPEDLTLIQYISQALGLILAYAFVAAVL
jgi:hypothetical protein